MVAKICIFWDQENIDLRGIKRKLDFLHKLIEFSATQGKVQPCYVYGRLSGKKAENFRLACKAQKINYVAIEAKTKNALDQCLTFDCVKTLGSDVPPDVVILVSGDRDYIPLVRCLRNQGKDVIILARKGSSSSRLLGLATQSYWISDFMRNPNSLGSLKKVG